MNPSLNVALYFARLILVDIHLYLPTPVQTISLKCIFAEPAESLVFDLSNVTLETIYYECFSAEKLSLLGASTFRPKRLSYDMGTFLAAKDLEMCLVIENSEIDHLRFRGSYIKGNCKGPKLIIVNNLLLTLLDINESVAKSLKSVPNAIRVRGNAMLPEKDLIYLRRQSKRTNGSWDLQELGECALPSPFISFHQLDRNCTSFYGRLTLAQGATQIEYDSSMVEKINIEGCIQIENTQLKDVLFLMAFSSFRPIPFCEQFIRNNEKLCTRNLNYLNVFFKNINFSNNSDPSCGACIGGHVSELYLHETANCTSVYGDLVISNFRELPLNIGNLREIQVIEGRLIIKNNTGLNVFNYLISLERILPKNESEAAIIITDNADLKLLLMPKLMDIDLKEGGEKVELLNNPLLIEETGQATMQRAFAATKNARIKEHEKIDTTADSKRRIANPGMYKLLGLLGLALTAVLLISVVITRSIFARQSNDLREDLMKNPRRLRRRSLEQLTSLCKEIVKRNPMVWSAEGCFVLDRNKAIGCSPVSSNQAEFVKTHLLPLVNNGLLSQRPNTLSNKCIQNRAQQILSYDAVVVLGADNDITKVIPCIPSSVGGIFAYTDDAAGKSVVYKLLEVTQLSRTLTYYKYEVKYGSRQNEKKNIEFLLYSWPTERLPTDSSDVLRLVAASNSRKVICASNRRKEVFSMLHLLHAIIMTARGPQSATEAFQLHAQFCNGAPLDRHEMLYVMRILLCWASSNNCLLEETRKWCQMYDYMADYSKKHKNIITIHPEFFPSLERCEEIQNEIKAVRKSATNLSERQFLPLADQFRRKTSKDLKEEAGKKSSFGIGIRTIGMYNDNDNREELITPPEEPSSTSSQGPRSLESWSHSRSSQSHSGMFLPGLQTPEFKKIKEGALRNTKKKLLSDSK